MLCALSIFIYVFIFHATQRLCVILSCSLIKILFLNKYKVWPIYIYYTGLLHYCFYMCVSMCCGLLDECTGYIIVLIYSLFFIYSRTNDSIVSTGDHDLKTIYFFLMFGFVLIAGPLFICWIFLKKGKVLYFLSKCMLWKKWVIF